MNDQRERYNRILKYTMIGILSLTFLSLGVIGIASATENGTISYNPETGFLPDIGLSRTKH